MPIYIYVGDRDVFLSGILKDLKELFWHELVVDCHVYVCLTLVTGTWANKWETLKTSIIQY